MKSLLFLLSGYLCLLISISAQEVFLPYYSDSLLTRPTPFAPGLIKGSAPAFTPDGKTVYHHIWDEKGHTIKVSYFRNGKWVPSQTAEFSGTHDELEPCITHDGSKLYFYSNRPVNGQASRGQILYMEKTGIGWSEPKTMDAPITIPGSGSGVPSISKNETLYFGSTRNGGKWPWEIYYSKLVNGKYSEAININDSINKGYLSWSHCIAPDESFIIFCSERLDGLGGIDLYVSFRENNKWTPAVNMGAVVNTDKGDVWPRLSPDGKYLFFKREEDNGPLYQIDIKPLLDSLKKKTKRDVSNGDIDNAEAGKSELSLKLPKIELDSAELFFESDNTIHAIAFDKKGLMYVGGRHKVFTIKPDKTIKHFVTLTDTGSNTIIWSMTFDRDGDLYVAANDRIIKVTPDGTQKVVIQENFSGPCGVTDLRFDKKGNLYAVYDNIVAKYDPSYKKSIFIDGSKFSEPVKWAVGIEFSNDEEYFYIGDCGNSKAYVVPISTSEFYKDTKIITTDFGQYFAKDKKGNIYLSSIGSFSNIPEFILLKNYFIHTGIYCKTKPLQDDKNFKKAIAYGEKGFDEQAIYCIIGSKIYAYRLNN